MASSFQYLWSSHSHAAWHLELKTVSVTWRNTGLRILEWKDKQWKPRPTCLVWRRVYTWKNVVTMLTLAGKTFYPRGGLSQQFHELEGNQVGEAETMNKHVNVKPDIWFQTASQMMFLTFVSKFKYPHCSHELLLYNSNNFIWVSWDNSSTLIRDENNLTDLSSETLERHQYPHTNLYFIMQWTWFLYGVSKL